MPTNSERPHNPKGLSDHEKAMLAVPSGNNWNNNQNYGGFNQSAGGMLGAGNASNM